MDRRELLVSTGSFGAGVASVTAGADSIWLLSRNDAETDDRLDVNDRSGRWPKSTPDRIYNIKKHFGAVGDGETEDTEAFQDAMEEAQSGGAIYVPPGEYPIRRVETFSNTIVFGEKAESKIIHAAEDLDQHPATSIFLTEGADDVEYRDLSFSGNLAAHEYSDEPGDANSELLDPHGGEYIRIVNCLFEEVLGGEAIDLDDPEKSYNYHIYYNKIDMTAHNQTGEGILSRGHGHFIAGNVVVGADSAYRGAIAVDEGSTSNILIGNVVEDSYRAFDIRQGPDGPTHTFKNNETIGEFEELSNLDGVADG